MQEKSFSILRIYIIALMSIGIGSLLLWDHYHGGVPSHHLLADENLPSISNWWGGVLLPLLGFFLTWRIKKRLFGKEGEVVDREIFLSVVYGFIGALIFGITLSVFFTLSYNEIPSYMLMSSFVLALFIPTYRSEYLFGFVIGMTYTFGGVLPTLIGGILLSIYAIIYLLIRAGIVLMASKLNRD